MNGAGGPSPIAYPPSEVGDRRRQDRAVLAFFLSMAFAAAVLILVQNVAMPALAAIALFVGAVAAVFVSLAWFMYVRFTQTADQVLRARARSTLPLPPPPPDPRQPVIPGEMLVDPRPLSENTIAVGGFFGTVAIMLMVVGFAYSAVRWGPLNFRLVMLVLIGLSLALLWLVLYQVELRRTAAHFARPDRPRGIFATPSGLEGPFYPFEAYALERGSAVIRSTWRRYVLGRLPAPNVVPWRLITVLYSVASDGWNAGSTILVVRPIPTPFWLDGLKITTDFFPAGARKDIALGQGLQLAIPRQYRATVLWMALQGGSRLLADQRQLTPAGQAACRAFAGAFQSTMSRPLGAAPHYLSLPPARNLPELYSWLA